MSSDRKREVSAGSRDERTPSEPSDASGSPASEEAEETTDDAAPKAAGGGGREADDTGAGTPETDSEAVADPDGDAEGDPDTEAEKADEKADDAPDVAAEVRDALRELVGRLDREAERAAHRESVIDRLHEENQRLRRGELEATLEPVRAALYKVHDTLRQAAASPPEPEQAAKLLGDCANEVADALGRTGTVRFEVEPGQPYDASRHRPVEAVEADDPDRAGTVLAVLSDGFENGGRVVRKAGVRVAKSVKSDARRRTERDDGHRRSAR
ncbi:nucleotide exchange factor GrpE [Spirillospora sp. NPDC049652]